MNKRRKHSVHQAPCVERQMWRSGSTASCQMPPLLSIPKKHWAAGLRYWSGDRCWGGISGTGIRDTGIPGYQAIGKTVI